jgi:hypothetical protein
VKGTFMPLRGNFDRLAATDVLWYAAGTAYDYLWYG